MLDCSLSAALKKNRSVIYETGTKHPDDTTETKTTGTAQQGQNNGKNTADTKQWYNVKGTTQREQHNGNNTTGTKKMGIKCGG